MTTPKNTETKTAKEGKPSLKLPWWVIGLGVIFPPALPFVLIGLGLSYPKTTTKIGAGAALACTALVIYASYEGNKSANKLFESKPSQEKTISSPEESESFKESTAEFACRKAVKESLVTKDGYHIPLGSVKTSKLASDPNKYITKFPFTAKNSFGVSMEHGAECVATGEGVVTEINQLY